MRAAALSRARRVFSRSADRAALPRSPPCPRSLSVRADACDDDAQRVVCDPSPPPRARPSAAHRDRRRSLEAHDTFSPKYYTLPRACAPSDPWPVARTLCWGAARRASCLPRGLRGASLAAQGAGRVARPTLTHAPRAAPPHFLFVHVLIVVGVVLLVARDYFRA